MIIWWFLHITIYKERHSQNKRHINKSKVPLSIMIYKKGTRYPNTTQNICIKNQKSCAGNFWMKINQKHLVYFEKWFIFWVIFGLFKSFGHRGSDLDPTWSGFQNLVWSGSILNNWASLAVFIDQRDDKSMYISIILNFMWKERVKNWEGSGSVFFLRYSEHVFYYSFITQSMNIERKVRFWWLFRSNVHGPGFDPLN